MATTKEFHDFVMDQLCLAGECSSRRMMGEYVVYCQGKVIGDICDNQLLLKPTPSVLRLLPDAERVYPYEGAKTKMAAVEPLEDTGLLREILSAMTEELPEPKKKRSGNG